MSEGIPEPILFLLFLGFFVLSGFYPLWRKVSYKLRRIRNPGLKNQAQAMPGGTSQQPYPELQLDDFEFFILERLAQDGRQRLTRGQINSRLHLEPDRLKEALRSLINKGMIDMEISALFTIRYFLSARGRSYVQEQGIITQLHSVEI